MTAVLLPHHHQQQQPVPIYLVEHRRIVCDSESAISHYNSAIWIRRICGCLFVYISFWQQNQCRNEINHEKNVNWNLHGVGQHTYSPKRPVRNCSESFSSLNLISWISRVLHLPCVSATRFENLHFLLRNQRRPGLKHLTLIE